MAQTFKWSNESQPILRSDLRIGRNTRDPQGHRAIMIQDPVLKGLMHPGYRVSPQVAMILECLDGTTTLQDLSTRVSIEKGLKVHSTTLEQFIYKLEELDLLDTPDTRRKRNTLEAQFVQMPVRPPSDFAEKFYPKEKGLLEEAIGNCFLGKNGPGPLPSVATKPPPTGLILPHGAIKASGQCTAWALHHLAHSDLPDLYVIIGHNHVYSGPPRAEILIRPFQTPFGEVEVDQDAATILLALAKDSIVTGFLSHYRDHSIEMELPFLQWLHRHSVNARSSNPCIIPLLITGERHRPGRQEPKSHQQEWARLAEILAQFLCIYRRRVVLVASGDFIHWGNLFNFTPFESKHNEDFYHWDRPLLEAINGHSPEQFLEAWQATNSCVGRPGYIVLKTLREHSWSMTNYCVDWNGDTAISFASFIAHNL